MEQEAANMLGKLTSKLIGECIIFSFMIQVAELCITHPEKGEAIRGLAGERKTEMLDEIEAKVMARMEASIKERAFQLRSADVAHIVDRAVQMALARSNSE